MEDKAENMIGKSVIRLYLPSLADFSQFVQIAMYIRMVKEKNRFLIVSLDLGSEYTSNRKDYLQRYIGVFNYVVLSQKEAGSLIGNSELPQADKNIQQAVYFNSFGNLMTKIVVIKNSGS